MDQLNRKQQTSTVSCLNVSQKTELNGSGQSCAFVYIYIYATPYFASSLIPLPRKCVERVNRRLFGYPLLNNHETLSEEATTFTLLYSLADFTHDFCTVDLY